MSSPADMAERRDRILADLAERGHALACRIHDDAMAADDPQVRAELALSFHRISRCVRQTLALEARFERDRLREAREDRDRAARDTEARVQARRSHVKAVVERLVWSEAEGDDAEYALDVLDDLLNEDALGEGFLDEPVEAYIEQLRYDLCLGMQPGREPRGPPKGDAKPRAMPLFTQPGLAYRRVRRKAMQAGDFSPLLEPGWHSSG